MAFVQDMQKGELIRPNRHDKLRRCEYIIFEDFLGKTILQINSIANTSRMEQIKTSLSLQFDERSAKQLLAALREAFPGIDEDDGTTK